MKQLSLLNLFLIFVKTGAILLGGGYVILPIMQSEFAEKKNLVSKEDLINYFALSQSMPGIIAANMSMFIGYKLRGKRGALIAMFGIIFVPFLCIILLASLLSMFVNNTILQGTLWGVGIAVIALIFLTAREVWTNAQRTLFFYIMFLFAFISLMMFNLTPITVIIIFSVLGVAVKCIQRGLIK